MRKLKIAEGKGPYLFSTNNFVGRQIWEYEPGAGTPEERGEVENARELFSKNCIVNGVHPCGDLLMRMQVTYNHFIDIYQGYVLQINKKETVQTITIWS